MERCPYCHYEGRQDQVDDHLVYMTTMVRDPEHEVEMAEKKSWVDRLFGVPIPQQWSPAHPPRRTPKARKNTKKGDKK